MNIKAKAVQALKHDRWETKARAYMYRAMQGVPDRPQRRMTDEQWRAWNDRVLQRARRKAEEETWRNHFRIARYIIATLCAVTFIILMQSITAALIGLGVLFWYFCGEYKAEAAYQAQADKQSAEL